MTIVLLQYQRTIDSTLVLAAGMQDAVTTMLNDLSTIRIVVTTFTVVLQYQPFTVPVLEYHSRPRIVLESNL